MRERERGREKGEEKYIHLLGTYLCRRRRLRTFKIFGASSSIDLCVPCSMYEPCTQI